MKIVIDIPEDNFKRIRELAEVNGLSNNLMGYSLLAIAHGTVLPEGHGDLIDRNYFEDKYAGCGSVYCEDISCKDCNSRIVNKLDVDSAPTIIESDKGE